MEGPPFFLQVRFFVDRLAGGKKCGKKNDIQSQRWLFIFVVPYILPFSVQKPYLACVFAAQACDRSFAET